MNRLVLVAALILTAIMFASGHAVQFLVTIIGMTFDLPGPLIDSYMSWIWFAFSMLFLFVVSYLFCRWFGHRVEKRQDVARPFD